MKKFDNIVLFNSLTHDSDNKFDRVIFDRLIDEFDLYIIFRKLYKKSKIKENVLQAELDDKIHFKIEFTNDSVNDKFIKSLEKNVIEFKGKKYTPHVKRISEHIIDITF